MEMAITWFFFYWMLAFVAVTMGYHRYWAHREGKRSVAFEWVTLSLGLFLGIFKPVGWIGVHRLHHKYTDTHLDPHSPTHNKWKVIFSDWSDTKIPTSIVRDVLSNKRILFFQKYGKYLIWPIIIFSPYTILLGYIGMAALNYFGHKNGEPANRWWIGIFAPLEGFHKDHHDNL